MLKSNKLIALTFLFAVLNIFPAFAATTIPFTVTLSEAVNVNGTPRIPIDVGGVARYATYTSGSGTATLTFTYTMVAGDVDLDGVTIVQNGSGSTYVIDLNGGTIKDLSGNDLSPLTYTPPNTSNVKVNYPSLGMDFVYDSDGRYTLDGTVYNDLTSFLSATGGSFARSSVGTYFDSAGTLQTAASGVPRFDYDPTTHAAKGILIEESRSNVLKYSEQLEQANWGKTYVNIASNTTSSPDGNMTADKFSADGSSNQHFLFIYSIFSSGTDYTVSFFVKKDTANYILASSTGSSYVNIQLNLNTGAKTATSSGGATLYNSSVQNLTNGWYWVRFSFRQTSGFTQDLRIYVYNTSTSEASTASAFVWGGQIEQGTFATSYIPTTSATVTRATDVLKVPTGSWFNNNALTVVSTINQNSLNNATAYPSTWSLNNGTPSNEIQLYTYVGSGTKVSNIKGVESGNVLYENQIYLPSSLPDKIKSASAFGSGAFSGTANGGSVYSYTGSIPSGLSNLQIGASNNGSANRANSSIEKIKYYPLRVSNTQLQLLTQ